MEQGLQFRIFIARPGRLLVNEVLNRDTDGVGLVALGMAGEQLLGLALGEFHDRLHWEASAVI